MEHNSNLADALRCWPLHYLPHSLHLHMYAGPPRHACPTCRMCDKTFSAVHCVWVCSLLPSATPPTLAQATACSGVATPGAVRWLKPFCQKPLFPCTLHHIILAASGVRNIFYAWRCSASRVRCPKTPAARPSSPPCTQFTSYLQQSPITPMASGHMIYSLPGCHIHAHLELSPPSTAPPCCCLFLFSPLNPLENI